MPTAEHLQMGAQGEALAVEYLRHNEWQILEVNWRFSRAEIDIIAMKNKLLGFIEVKTRRNSFFGTPEMSVNERKQLLLADAAAAYMRQIGHEWEFRFDVIAIILSPQSGDFQLRHHEDAFFPPLG